MKEPIAVFKGGGLIVNQYGELCVCHENKTYKIDGVIEDKNEQHFYQDAPSKMVVYYLKPNEKK